LVRFRFYKPETEKTRKKTESNQFEQVVVLKNRTETGRFEPVLVFLKKEIWFGYFFYKNRTENDHP
jgi:hypothetical protein